MKTLKRDITEKQRKAYSLVRSNAVKLVCYTNSCDRSFMFFELPECTVMYNHKGWSSTYITRRTDFEKENKKRTENGFKAKSRWSSALLQEDFNILACKLYLEKKNIALPELIFSHSLVSNESSRNLATGEKA